jgi:hypothetical protein
LGLLLKYHKSAVAADSVLHKLSRSQKSEIKIDIECMEKYTTTKQFQPACKVLAGYGITQ